MLNVMTKVTVEQKEIIPIYLFLCPSVKIERIITKHQRQAKSTIHMKFLVDNSNSIGEIKRRMIKHNYNTYGSFQHF